MKIETVPVSKRLKEALDIRGMKQIELSEKTKISKGSINQYLTGYAEPKSDRIFIMSQALNVNPVWLMGLEAPMELTPSEDISRSEQFCKAFNYADAILHDKRIIIDKIRSELYALNSDQLKLVYDIVLMASRVNTIKETEKE